MFELPNGWVAVSLVSAWRANSCFSFPISIAVLSFRSLVWKPNETVFDGVMQYGSGSVESGDCKEYVQLSLECTSLIRRRVCHRFFVLTEDWERRAHQKHHQKCVFLTDDEMDVQVWLGTILVNFRLFRGR